MGQVYPLIPGRTSVLGRDPGADVTIASDRVSRRHCQFDPQAGGAYVLVDLGSANGTLVNQSRIDGRKPLKGGEYIQAGDCLFRYCER
jgi:pSer/pThr/pTyr-binding forkhead associated (FHA) protein